MPRPSADGIPGSWELCTTSKTACGCGIEVNASLRRKAGGIPGDAANEYDTLIENGEDRATSWAVTLGAVSEERFRFPERSEPEPRVEKLSDLESAVRFYRASSLKEISRVDRELTGTFTSCPKRRLTYFIEYRSMIYATGKATAERAARHVIVLPGRVIPEGRDPALASAPAYGLVNSWQATQWQLC